MIMRRVSLLIAGFVVVTASCGNRPEVPGDTEDVAPQTLPLEPFPTAQDVEVENAKAPAPPVAPSFAAPESRVGFVAGTRFTVFAREEEASFAVFDRERGETFRVLGTPLGEAAPTFDRYFDFGLSQGAPQLRRESANEGRMLVRSIGGVQLVDLGDRGRMIAAWRGTPSSASIAPDGRSYSVSTSDAIHVVRAEDGAVATFNGSADGPIVPHWGERNVA